MPGSAAPYIVAIAAMLFSAASGLTLIYTFSHLDPPEDSANRPTRRAA
jgi:hypothetical protein